MNRGQVYASRKNFIEEGVGNVMSAKKDFASIQYARNSVTDQEYIRVRDIFGNSVTIDITDVDLETIASDMCRVMLIGEEKISPPDGIVTDKEALRRISALFN